MDRADVPILIILGFISAACGVVGVLIHERMKRAVEEEVSWREDTDRGTLERYAPDEVEPPDDEE